MLVNACLFSFLAFTPPQLEVDWSGGIRNQLLQNFEVLSPTGTLGTLSVFGENATVVLAGGKDGSVPIAGASSYGKGRVFAIAHSGYLGVLGKDGRLAKTASANEHFMHNVKRWLGGGLLSPKIIYTDQPIKEWKGVDFFIWRGSKYLTDEIRAKLLEQIKNGAGILFAECPWGWSQITGKSIRDQMPQNKLLAEFGMVFGGGYAGTNEEGGFAVTKSKPEPPHAGAAIQKLKSGVQLNKVENNSVERLLSDLPMRHPVLVDLQNFFSALSGKPPTENSPLTAKDAENRFWVTMYSRLWQTKTPDNISAASGAEVFPGAVPGSAKRVSKTLDLARTHDGWLSTGLYLPAGEQVSFDLIGGDPSGWQIRIGCHSDRLWGKDKWTRWPEISFVFELQNCISDGLATPWGGLVYFVPRKNARSLRVRVNGVVSAPEFRLGDDESKRNWRQRRLADAPWGELVGKHVILSVPSKILRTLGNPEEVCAYWDKLWLSHCELASIEVPKRPERFVADQQISAGYMHSGYPIMTWLDVVTEKNDKPAPVLDLETLREFGNWGYFHELGHNRQRPWWTFSGTGEVTNNLFSLHGGEVMAGINPWENKWLRGQKKSAKKYLNDGADWSKWKKSPGIALVCFALVQREFGWEPFQRFFASFENEPSEIRPSKDQDKIDQWVIRLSLEVGHDLRPYFQSWGWPVSKMVNNHPRLNELPPWEAPTDWLN